MTSCIIVTSSGTACPVAPAPDTPDVERRIKRKIARKSAITLAACPYVIAKIKGGVPVKRKP